MTSTFRKKESGFTIIELMIATTIFSFILLVATVGIIRIGQLYYKGVTESKTQENARKVSDEVTRSIQFSKGVKVDHPDNTTDLVANPVKRFCLGDTRYTGFIDQPFDAKKGAGPSVNKTGLWAEKLVTGSSCACPSACVQETNQLLGTNVRLLKFDLTNLGAGIDKAWQLNLRVAYGDSDLMTHYDDNGVLLPTGSPQERADKIKSANCKAGNSSASFCSVAELDTVVKKRLN